MPTEKKTISHIHEVDTIVKLLLYEVYIEYTV